MQNPLFDTLFARHAHNDDPFLHLGEGKCISYRCFVQRTAQYAHALQKAGLAPGDRLAVQIGKSAEALALYAGAVRAGVVFLPLNTAYTASELGYFVENSGAALLVGDAGGAMAQVARDLGTSFLAMEVDGSGALSGKADAASATFDTVARNPDDLAALLYTSGTTGRSKGAMLSQANLLSNAEVLAQAWRFTRDDTLLHALPIFHTHGLFVATNVMALAGGAMVFLPKFDIDAVIATLPRATSMMGVPTFYTRLLDDSRFTRDLAGHMRLFISGSAPLLAETHRAFEDRTGHRILERYGMTETNMNTSNPYDGDRRAGTVGPPLPGTDVRITDPTTGTALPEGDIGMVEVRGPNVFQGYWQMPEKTAEEMRDDGFFITGDLGRFDDGYLQIVGRSKDLIIAGGFNIYPKEVEEALDALPGVLESAVIGVPHPDLGEGVVAVVVPIAGEMLDPTTLAGEVAKTLARFKQPRHYEVVKELPRNTMGKVQKATLRKTYRDVFA